VTVILCEAVKVPVRRFAPGVIFIARCMTSNRRARSRSYLCISSERISVNIRSKSRSACVASSSVSSKTAGPAGWKMEYCVGLAKLWKKSGLKTQKKPSVLLSLSSHPKGTLGFDYKRIILVVTVLFELIILM
jgi:hypothetical protein